MIFSRKNLPTGFYIYFYLRTDGTPYYCGKGCRDRAWTDHSSHGIWTPNNDRIVIAEHRLTNTGALALERFYIRWYGRINLGTGILHNKTDGGDGIAGAKTGRTSDDFSEEWRKNISVAKTGKTIAWNKGLSVPEEQKQRQSATKKSKRSLPGYNIQPKRGKWIHHPITLKTRLATLEELDELKAMGWCEGRGALKQV